MFTKELLQDGLIEISTSAIDAQDVDRVECVRCDLVTLHNSITKYSAEVIAAFTGRHEGEYYRRYAEAWAKKFSTFTGTPWVHAYYAKSRIKLPYHFIFKCHNKTLASSEPYATVGQNLNKLVGGPSECKSCIIIKFRNPREKDKGTLVRISIDNSYCKRLHIQHYFQSLASDDRSWIQKYLSDVKGPPPDNSDPLVRINEVYYRYLVDGHTYQTAKMYHLLKLLCKYGNIDNVPSDPAQNPTMSYVMCIWRHSKLYMKDVCFSFNLIMSRKQTELEKLGGLLTFEGQDLVTIIAPSMKRVLLSCVLEQVIISSIELNQGPVVTLFFIPSKIGALCFACILHKEKTQEAYSKALSTVKAAIEIKLKQTFNPEILILDSISNEYKLAVLSVFPKSYILITPWCLCRHAWVWICNTKYKKLWHETMIRFHKIMHAADLKTAEEYFTYHKFLYGYLNEIWKEYKLRNWWSGAKNTLIELSIRLLQQFFINKCASFNMVQLYDIICTLDTHFQQTISWSVHKKQPILKMYSKLLDKCELNTLKLELTSPREFSISGGYRIRTDTWCCDCTAGRKGLYCDHLCKFMDMADVTVELDDDEKQLFKKLAGKTFEAVHENCKEAINLHPTFTDGYYLFYLPLNTNILFTYKLSRIELSVSGRESYNLIINDLIDKYKSMNGIFYDILNEDNERHNEKDNEEKIAAKRVSESNKTLDEPAAGKLVENVTLVSQNCKRQKTRHVNNEKIEEAMDTDSADQKQSLSINAEDSLTNSETVMHIKDTLTHEIDLKFEPIENVADNEGSVITEAASENDKTNSSVNISEADYYNALENLRTEFNKFKDRLWLSPSARKLECVVRLTKQFSQTRAELLGIKQFSQTRAELLGIKCEPVEHNADVP